ncbi:MAG: site-2 protease family protein [Planctomycetota bacterium]
MTDTPAAGKTPRHPGSIFLFQAFGIPVFVHWTWGLLVAFVVATDFLGMGPAMNVVALIGLFAIVTLHEYGHALAARSVGGTADRIVLMPLGGLAYIQPPARPWPFVWAVVAGPLVNVALIPVFAVLVAVTGALPAMTQAGVSFAGMTDLQEMVFWLASVNVILLVFNMLPIYPLDGGQTLQGILWVFMGRASSLRVAATIGLVASLAIGVLMLVSGAVMRSPFLFLIAIFLAMESFRGLAVAKYLATIERDEGQHVEPWELRVRRSPSSGPRGPFGGGPGPGSGRGDDVIEGEVVDRR